MPSGLTLTRGSPDVDAELARQIGQGLDRLSASLLSHQEASARDRHAMLEKLDAIHAKFDAKFDALADRIVDVCDRGRGEHRSFDERLGVLELRLTAAESRAAGRADILKPAMEWAGKNWLALAVAAAFTFQSYVAPAIARAFTAPTQAVEIRGAL